MIAWAIRKWKEQYPPFRCCVLAHRKELIEQNESELKKLYPGSDVGIFSAALGKRDYESSILYASIDSVHKRAGEFEPWDVIMVDEAHRIPYSGEGKYRTFLNESRRFNEDLKLIGWTATAFRMAGGQICHRDHILNFISYEAKVTDLINDGYLCQLRSKVGEAQPELNEVRRNSGGDYVLKSLAEATNRKKVVEEAVQEAARIIKAENRKAVIFFTVDIEHCKNVSAQLRMNGIYAPVVTSKTPQLQRDAIVREFKAGRLRGICNVNVFTEGFNAQNVDCIVLLRPTLSPGLYSQMVGRGLRGATNKIDCLVLDFASCIDEHGPIDLLGGETTVMAVCGECRESFSRAIRSCPSCRWEIPKQEIERLEKVESEKKLHGSKASRESILSSEPQVRKVNAVLVNRHRKEGSPDSLRVQYRCGLSMHREWICLDHAGYAGQQAQAWWRTRGLGKNMARGEVQTVNAALENMFLTQEILDWTKTITVIKKGKFFEIVGYNKPLTEVVA